MDFSKSSSGRTTWTITEGRLQENGPGGVFKLTGIDSQILLDLLLRNEQEIRRAAHKELHPNVDSVRVDACLDNMPSESGPKTS